MGAGISAVGTRQQSLADATMRRLLFIKDRPRSLSESEVKASFSLAMVISALRCLLTYVVLPFLGPVLGTATSLGPAIGIPLGVVALVFDVRGIRRFFLVNHRYRWAMAVIYVGVMALVVSLVAGDISKLAH